MPGAASPPSLEELRDIVRRHWGFQSLKPLQEQAMQAALQGRDTLVVLPTGGGKSLCYQAPAVARGDTTVVVSPLIALMKDQVDSLQACGVPAIQLDSMQTAKEKFVNEQDVREGKMRLLFVSPERLVLTDIYQLLRHINVRTFAIDEAHCISHWGHDFRPEYRQLNRLKEHFPGASVHAYTATATERVRRDIIEQLRLAEPAVLVGNFDRPNLTYRVVFRSEFLNQVEAVLARHPRQAGIIYCIRRLDVDELAANLQKKGHKVLPYHAGMTPEERKKTQEAFATEQCDIIVATVAFGMGINRSNIRFVLHAAMPKSMEHYQQEIGRAGRDGLEAECVILYSGADFATWKWILEQSAKEPGVPADFLPNALKHLNDLDRYARGAACRHKALVEYFGQQYTNESCGACDLCLGDTEPVADALLIAQKILSCVARVKERFGIGHVSSVLRGESTEGINRWGHAQLSTYGLLADRRKPDLRNWIYQLIGQGVLVQEDLQLSSGNSVPILKLNEASWEVMRGKRQVRLLQPVQRKKGEKTHKAEVDAASWEGVDEELFEVLRALRRDIASERSLPPYVIFHDSVLRQLARVRPASLVDMRLISGIGDAKLRDIGQRVLNVLDEHCRARDLSRNNAAAPPPQHEPAPSTRPNVQRDLAFQLFRQGKTLDEVSKNSDRSRRTLCEYLCDFIRSERPASLAPWVSEELYQRVAAAARQVGVDRLKPLFIALDEKVPYEVISIVLADLKSKST
ncbi:MAG TPA: DNA helicase RecQ [Gemmataceae bacterium]|nr:DNA helicase RecQ [Gemmataceae bacterium]